MFEYIEYERTETYLEVSGKRINLNKIKRTIQTVMLMIICCWAFLYGSNMAYQQLHYSIYFSKPKCDIFNNCVVRELVINGSSMSWVKVNKTGVFDANIQ